VELTESTAIVDMAKAVETAMGLKKLGIDIIIDNFGSGYSSMTWLKYIGARAVKIDRFFIQNLVDDPNNAAIVVAIIALARHFGFRVVAEGVETRAQLDYLRSLKLELRGSLSCDLVQGFLFARPVPVEEIGEMLARGLARTLETGADERPGSAGAHAA
jgi:EAL domain-containing protein (putative c-di-GMP-specific phosphodiesterase class I)